MQAMSIECLMEDILLDTEPINRGLIIVDYRIELRARKPLVHNDNVFKAWLSGDKAALRCSWIQLYSSIRTDLPLSNATAVKAIMQVVRSAMRV